MIERVSFERFSVDIEMVKKIWLSGVFASLMLSGCASFYTASPYLQAGSVGGLAGGAIGAGTGAIVGSLISSGNVGQSALLGTAIGVPTGIALGVGYQYYQEEKEIDENNEIIEQNHDYIVSRQAEIDNIRRALTDESFRIKTNDKRKGNIYTGPAIGVYR